MKKHEKITNILKKNDQGALENFRLTPKPHSIMINCLFTLLNLNMAAILPSDLKQHSIHP